MSFFDHRNKSMRLLSAEAEQGGGEGRLLGAIDFGAAKTVCLIGWSGPEGLAVTGIGFAKPQTGADGAPLDFDACVRAVRIAVDQAERASGETVTSVVAGIGGKGVSSRLVSGAVTLAPGPIAPKAVRAALNAALAQAGLPGRALLHAVPLGYRVDGGPLRADPRGAEGKQLTAELTVVTAPEAAVAAITDCIIEAGLRVERVVASPYAAALAVLSPEEMAMGAVALDFGASHVGVAAFQGGALMLAENAPVGGADLTADIAQRIGANFAAAERIKVLHGGFSAAPPQEVPIEAPRIGADGRLEAAVVSRGVIVEAMGPRLEEMLAAVRARLAPVAAREGQKPWRAAVAGGGSYLSGLRDLAEHVLSRPVRPGRPVGFGALDEGPQAASFAVAAGLLRFMADPPAEAVSASKGAAAETPVPKAAIAPLPDRVGGAMGRAWSWLKENF